VSKSAKVVLGRVLINAQIAAPFLLGQLHQFVQKIASVVQKITGCRPLTGLFLRPTLSLRLQVMQGFNGRGR
jgi:hypothetical protein